jgi:hypothetical protein
MCCFKIESRASICPGSHMYKCVVWNGNLFFAYLMQTPWESGVTARDQPLLMATLKQWGLSALLKGTSTDFSTCRLGYLKQRPFDSWPHALTTRLPVSYLHPTGRLVSKDPEIWWIRFDRSCLMGGGLAGVMTPSASMKTSGSDNSIYVCARVCASAWANTCIYTYDSTYTFVFVHTSVCLHLSPSPTICTAWAELS